MSVSAVLVALAIATSIRFEDFAVTELFAGTPAPVVLASSRARQFRTVLTDEAKNAPNFAGHYRVATWGCGSDCHAFAIIDAVAGSVYFKPEALWVGGQPGNEEDRIQFRQNSRLLVLVGSRNDKGVGKYYYEWTGKELRPIR
jgi:hypothetical protein